MLNDAVEAQSFQPWKYSGEKLPIAEPSYTPTNKRGFDIPLQKQRGAEFIRVTPEMAKHWLSFNTTNRNVRPRRLERYVNLLRQDKFKINGESVKFAYGKLLDGQHRLMAILVTGKAAVVLAVYGLDSGVQDTVDTGAARSAGDVLGIEGLDYFEAHTLGTAAHAIINYLRGGLPVIEHNYDNAEVKGFFLENSVAAEATMKFMRPLLRRPTIAPYSVMTAFHYIFAMKDRELADQFFEQLITGIGIVSESPIGILRAKLNANAIAKRRVTRYQIGRMFVATWNAMRRGARWKSGQSLTNDSGGFPDVE